MSSARYRSEIVLRALAISWVVLNHAYSNAKYPDLDINGGMNFLLMLSGFSLARFGLDLPSASAARQAVLRLAQGIALPTLLMIAAYAVVHLHFDIREFLLIKNWFAFEGIGDFPRWYPQVIIQLLLVTWAALWAPGAHALLARRPLASCAALLAAGLSMLEASHRFPVMNAEGIGLSLPYIYAWNFILGWLVFYLAGRPAAQGDARVRKAAATLCVIACAYVALGPGRLAFWGLSIAGAVMIWTPSIALPEIVGRPLSIVSQATFAVFLLHVTMFKVFTRILPDVPPLKAAFSIAASVGVWIVVVAAVRAHRALTRSQIGGLAKA